MVGVAILKFSGSVALALVEEQVPFFGDIIGRVLCLLCLCLLGGRPGRRFYPRERSMSCFVVRRREHALMLQALLRG